MSKKQKRKEAIRRNPRGVRPDELEQVLFDAGFTRDKGKGDHRNYNLGGWDFTLDYGKDPVKKVYVEQVIAMLDQIAPLATNLEDDNEEVQPDGE